MSKLVVDQLQTLDETVARDVAEIVEQSELSAAIASISGNIEGKADRTIFPSYIFETSTPFGAAGLKVLRGERYDAHYGLENGWIIYPSGKWVLIFRRGSDHGTTDGAEVRAADSYDKGQTLVNERVIYTNPNHDARPNKPRLLGNGRAGFIVNRASEGAAHYSPIVIYSDDEFATWDQTEITTSSPYTFSSTGGMLDFPASQGGDDVEGFIAYGFLTGGTYDAVYTTDNWATYTIVSDIASISSPITGLSEWSGARIGNQDKWLFYLRNKDAGGWRDEAACFITTNLLNWGSAVSSGISLGGNPPSSFFDEATNMFHFIGFGRSGRGIDGQDHHILIASADGDELYNAGGDWSALTPAIDWQVLAPVPNWATGYISEVKDGDKWVGTFCAGEPGLAGGARSALMMIGDFTPSGADQAKVTDVMLWNATVKEFRSGFASTVRPSVAASLSGSVAESSPGLLTENFGTQDRKHYVLRNDNGEGGSVSLNGSTTSFNTTSDLRLKGDLRALDQELDIDKIIDLLQPIAWGWLDRNGNPTGVIGHGLGAQDCEAVYPHAVTPGKGEPGDPDFSPWSVDYSKLVVILLSKIKRMDDRIKQLESQ